MASIAPWNIPATVRSICTVNLQAYPDARASWTFCRNRYTVLPSRFNAYESVLLERNFPERHKTEIGFDACLRYTITRPRFPGEAKTEIDLDACLRIALLGRDFSERYKDEIDLDACCLGFSWAPASFTLKPQDLRFVGCRPVNRLSADRRRPTVGRLSDDSSRPIVDDGLPVAYWKASYQPVGKIQYPISMFSRVASKSSPVKVCVFWGGEGPANWKFAAFDGGGGGGPKEEGGGVYPPKSDPSNSPCTLTRNITPLV